MLCRAKGFGTINQEIRETGRNSGGRSCDLLSAFCVSQSVKFLSTNYLQLCHGGLPLLVSVFHSGLRRLLPCLPISNNPNQYCFTLLLHTVFLKALHTHTHTHTHNPIIHKQPRHAGKLLQRASQYKPRRHILQPKFMSCYLLCGRERTWEP